MPTQATTLWEAIPAQRRKALVWGLWFVTWVGLIAGFFDRYWFTGVVAFSALHAVLFLQLFSFRITPFPVQVRIAYLIWVALGTYVPGMMILMYITVVGLATNLFLGYCPLARMMYLVPWNLSQEFSLNLLGRVIFSPPMHGKFEPRPRRTSVRLPAHPR